jgi:putative endonuclease
MTYFVYMMASKPNGTIYIGMTNDLVKRAWEHRNHVVEGFTDTHRVECLVWYEQHDSVEEAIKRENVLNKYKRDWKIKLIETDNSRWDDLFNAIASG